MMDDLSGGNPFESLAAEAGLAPAAPTPEQPEAPAAAQDSENPFTALAGGELQKQSTALGAFARGAERSALPSVGGLAAAPLGAEAGAAIGALGGPLAPVTVPAGALIGGLGAAVGGGMLVDHAQQWALSKLPEEWKDAVGADDAQAQADATQHGMASFLGGLVPFALTMSPRAAAVKLPENATAMQRIMANPATARLFGGAIMGGMELGQEKVQGEPLDWQKIGIATGFGLLFNKPNRVGQAILSPGENAARAVFGRNHPTVAQAADLNVVGPGVTEETFMGTHERAPEAALTAHEEARSEGEALGLHEPAPADVHAVARHMAPDLFARYDDLARQREEFRRAIQDAPDSDAARRHYEAVDAQMREIAPEVSATYRRAADYAGGEAIEPLPPDAQEPDAQEPAARDGSVSPGDGSVSAAPVRPIAEQKQFIADDVTRQLVAAGRPEEEARAAGALVAERYATRAARFKGKIGTAEELYMREGAEIRGPRGAAPPAGPGAPQAPRPAPLMPTAEKPEVAPERPLELAATGEGRAAPSNLESIDARQIDVDAKRMQFKAGGDEAGVTERLKDVGEWNPMLAGTVIVWRDAAGKNWIADGHQRLGLAKRLMEGGHPPIKVNAFVLSEGAGISDAAARVLAAAKNIAEGTGTAVDAAKVIREAKDAGINLPPLPPRSALVKDGQGLARLSPGAFGAVINEVVPANYGAIVGRLVEEELAQAEAIRLLAKTKPDNARQADLIIKDMLATGVEHFTQESLFGEEAFAGSVVLERAKIVDDALKLLKSDRKTFRTLVAESDRITGHGGNVLDTEANKSRLSEDERVQEFVEKLATRAGPVSDALTAVAKHYKSGEISRAEAARSFLGDVRRGSAEAVDAGAGAGGPVDGAGGEREQLTAAAAYQGFLEGRSGMAPARAATGGYSRNGVAIRPKSRQDWQPGNVVDVGFVKDLVIASRADDGTFTLLGKPDAEGKSQSYSVEPHKGLRKAERVDFLDATRDLRSDEDQTLELFQKTDDLFDYEKGAEGKPQALIPGVAPVTDKSRAELAASKPLRGGNAPMPEGGLFDDNARSQEELFQSARGKINLAEGRKPIITLMKDANASTFIHETGHQWLEEMMRDAAHPDAPALLKDDATTVLDWLGAKSAEEIKTRHHEKFARGFEQYMREGVAPSSALAKVFAGFKNWLLQIYQTIRGLGAPINDDIRGVFDRMLAEEPQRTIIAPEREAGPSLADIHETDAATIEPHEAEPAADRIALERERAIFDVAPEVARELEAESAKLEAADGAGIDAGTEAGEGASGLREIQPLGGEPQPVPGGGAYGAELRPVGARGNDAAPEGGGASSRASGDAGAAGAAGSQRGAIGNHPLAPRPKDLFGDEPRFTDKAGNIRVENLTTNEDVAEAIREAARENNEFIGDRRGVVTDGQVMDLAEAIGMRPEDLFKRNVGQAFNAEQVVAARKLLIQSATDVAAAMKKAAASGADEDVMAYAIAKDRHQMIQAQIAGITAEAGRALRAFRDISGLGETKAVDQFIRGATGKTLFQLRREAQLGAALETPQQVSKFMRDAQERSFSRMILEYWINALLSGPATHATNMIGNTIMALQAFPEAALAAKIGAARRAGGREGAIIHTGELGAKVSAIREGFAPALKAGVDALRTGSTTLLPGEDGYAPLIQTHEDLAHGATLDQAASLSDAKAAAFGLVRGVRDAILTNAVLLSKGGVAGAPLFEATRSLNGHIPDFAIRGVNIAPLGTVARLPGRFLAAEDSFFRALNYSMTKSALAYREAVNEGRTGTRLAQRVADLRENPTQDIMDAARMGASELTFMDKAGEFTQAMSRLANSEIFGAPLLRFVAPFINIAGKIADQTLIKRTPIGFLSPEMRADLMGKNGTVAQDMAQARMLLGTALAVAFGSLAAEGYVSGSGPKDPAEAAMWKLAGNQAHSIRIGDTWYDTQKLGPLGALVGLSADFWDIAKHAAEDEASEVAGRIVHAFAQNILDQSFMKGAADLIKAIEDPDRYGGQYARNFGSSFVPFSGAMGQTARMLDPYSRDARTMADAIKAKIPGLSEELAPRRDIWGEPIPNREALVGKGLTSVYVSHVSNDPVNRTMVQLGIAPGKLPRKIRGVELDAEQYDDFQRIAGRMAKSRLDQIVTSAQFSSWPPYARRDVIKATITQSREAARNMMLMKYPAITKQAVDDRRAALRGEDIEPIE